MEYDNSVNWYETFQAFQFFTKLNEFRIKTIELYDNLTELGEQKFAFYKVRKEIDEYLEQYSSKSALNSCLEQEEINLRDRDEKLEVVREELKKEFQTLVAKIPSDCLVFFISANNDFAEIIYDYINHPLTETQKSIGSGTTQNIVLGTEFVDIISPTQFEYLNGQTNQIRKGGLDVIPDPSLRELAKFLASKPDFVGVIVLDGGKIIFAS